MTSNSLRMGDEEAEDHMGSMDEVSVICNAHLKSGKKDSLEIIDD